MPLYVAEMARIEALDPDWEQKPIQRATASIWSINSSTAGCSGSFSEAQLIRYSKKRRWLPRTGSPTSARHTLSQEGLWPDCKDLSIALFPRPGIIAIQDTEKTANALARRRHRSPNL